MTYTLVNLPFLAIAAVLVVLALARGAKHGGRRALLLRLGLTVLGVAILTAVFDNVIVGLGIVDYDGVTTSGIRIGLAPIEDFAYALAAATGLPALWVLLPRSRKRTLGESPS